MTIASQQAAKLDRPKIGAYIAGFLETVKVYFAMQERLLELTSLRDEALLYATLWMVGATPKEIREDSQNELAERTDELQHIAAAIRMRGWRNVDYLASIQLDTRDLRKFLHLMEDERSEEACALWDNLRLDLEGIALRLRYEDAGDPQRAEKSDQQNRQNRMTVEEANRKAVELTEKDSHFVHRSQREWADAIGCSVGLVSKLPLWQKNMEISGRRRNGHAAIPKAVSLTASLEKTIGENEDELKRLIREQRADDRRRHVGSRERV